MQQGLHCLIRPFGNLCLGADRRAGVVLVGRQSGEAAELPRIPEARKASCDGDHVDGDSFPDSVYALQQLLLSAQYRICGDERINLLINDLYLLVYDLNDLLPALVFMFVELHRFRKGLHECVSLVDKWCYSLKHVGSLDRLPEELRVRAFERLFEACEIAKFTPEEKLRYEHDMITERDYDNIIYTAKVEGRTEGKAEGKTDVARAMKAKGLETSLISELTGLSEEEIQRL